jgi:hypothetical protein
VEEIDYRPRAEVNRLANYGWRLYEGRVRHTRSGCRPRRAGERLFAPTGLLRHGRLRLPRTARSREPRPLLLRRLVHCHHLEPADQGRPSC